MAFFEPIVFEGVLYHPDESQILTCGTNHKLTYWDASDGNAIRVITGGEQAMTSIDIDSQGEYFFTGSEDSTVKVRSEEHTSELQSLMRISYAVFCLKKQKQ